MQNSHRLRRLRIWIVPFSLLLSLGTLILVVSLLLDTPPDKGVSAIIKSLFYPSPQSAAETLSNTGEVVAALLAIAITVVAIIVELAATRYTHRITELFITNPVNFCVMGFFVITAMVCMWTHLAFDYSESGAALFVPYTGIRVSMLLLTFCLLILLPYFAYVFAFLNPVEIVDRIRKQTILKIRRSIKNHKHVESSKMEALRGIEQLADIARNAMENKDKGVSMASVERLYTLFENYLRQKQSLPPSWFLLEGELIHNPDFVSMAPDVLKQVSENRIWLEMKILRQYQIIYHEALNRSRDINYLIAINTRKMANVGREKEDDALIEMVIKFFNTFLRATINAKDVRTAYNVLNQYRSLAESLLNYKGGKYALEIAHHFKYYGLISFHADLPFILETIAYDLCHLNEIVYDDNTDLIDDMLEIFLDVDKESETAAQEASLRGVRKAQIKLATFYLFMKSPVLAHRIFEDMEFEDPSRLLSIREELQSVQSPDFWEISDRGFNFDYLSPSRKEKMSTFFQWFGTKLDSSTPEN